MLADLCLVLLLDASQSMSSDEWKLLAEATAAAVSSPDIVRRIGEGPTGRIHVLVAEWSGQQHVIVPWTTIAGQADADALGQAIAGWTRRQSGFTRLGDALAWSGGQMIDAPPCARRTIDVSTDGKNNQGPEPGPAIAALEAQGVEVNAIVIEGEAGVVDWYKATVPGFVMPASWETYEQAIRAKLSREIAGVSPDLWKHPFPVDRSPGCAPLLRSTCGMDSSRFAAIRYEPWGLGWPSAPEGPLPLYPDIKLSESVPAPGAAWLLGLALVGLVAWRNRR